MPIRRSQKKRNAEPRQKQNHRRLVIDPMVNPGSSAHRHQARSKADPTRPHHRMVTLAQSSPGDRSARAPQSKTATVMLEQDGFGTGFPWTFGLLSAVGSRGLEHRALDAGPGVLVLAYKLRRKSVMARASGISFTGV